MSAIHLQFLDVFLGEVLVGRLSRAGDVVQFLGEAEYLDDPHRPTLSLAYNSLDPLHGEAITRKTFTQPGTQWTRALGRMPAFFENLLPEGALRDLLAKARGVGVDDQFDLLAATGRSLPGALVVRPSDLSELGTRLGVHADSLLRTTEHDPAIADVVAQPLDGGFSLAGQQMKLAMSMVEKGHRYTLKTRHSEGLEIIAKLPSANRLNVVETEFAGMSLARAAGVDVPDFWMEDTGVLDVPEITGAWPNGKFLAITRFDRPQGKAPVHMEDWCQINGRRARDKYAPEDAFVQGLAAIHAYAPERFDDARQFMRRQVANVLMGNSDAHLKNFSFIYPDGRHPQLSPAYDMVPLIAYLHSGQFGLNEHIEKQYQRMTVEDFKRVGFAAGFAPKAIEKEVRATVERIRDEWPKILPELPIDDALRATIQERIDSMDLVKSVQPASSVSHRARGPKAA